MKVRNEGEAKSFTYAGMTYLCQPGVSDWPEEIALHLEQKYGHIGINRDHRKESK